MWTFAVSLLLVDLYPGSLLMPGILGFLVQLTVAVLGTVVGDYVDTNTRRKGKAGFFLRAFWISFALPGLPRFSSVYRYPLNSPKCCSPEIVF